PESKSSYCSPSPTTGHPPTTTTTPPPSPPSACLPSPAPPTSSPTSWLRPSKASRSPPGSNRTSTTPPSPFPAECSSSVAVAWGHTQTAAGVKPRWCTRPADTVGELPVTQLRPTPRTGYWCACAAGHHPTPPPLRVFLLAFRCGPQRLKGPACTSPSPWTDSGSTGQNARPPQTSPSFGNSRSLRPAHILSACRSLR